MVQLTKEEATELSTIANEFKLMLLTTDYHISFSFVICIYFIFRLLMLVVPRNSVLVDGKEPFVKGAVSPFLSNTKKDTFL